ncbi:uncharacterized protein YeaO (DUF488 family) [Chitinophaga dinghuensis]|uniref:Uncharacterized protein YeaO (DUF488 family) n=1 Tax=Chitinophaga dinghuensis TaxID=1539050 RepID=A0A327WAZ3_9BACT|nr:DUF488 domain-containing protein [Chitinophaga dinghuensis]RAJ83238.1 uncharacterized protein YeaO (DUF488 family) [Chitinophaga dinghuensis]
MIQIKRVYEEYEEKDGYRILVDRLWPRGLSREKAHLDEWLKDIAPTDELRKWFNHDPERYTEFKQRYEKELKEHAGLLEEIRKKAAHHRVTLLYGAHDEQHNQAVVLLEVLSEKH